MSIERYELTVLFKPEKVEEAVRQITERVFEREKGHLEVLEFENAGTKVLAYPMGKYKKATYMYFTLEVDNSKCPPCCITTALESIDGVLRYLYCHEPTGYVHSK